MKRVLEQIETDTSQMVERIKKRKEIDDKEEEEMSLPHLDENLIFEILKHVDAKSLATASCVNKAWYRTAQDERLWELICTRRWANIGCGNQQLRSVVLALGGFRRLHSHCLWPLFKPPSSSISSSIRTQSTVASAKQPQPTHWGKDEVNLSLSLLSIRFYEKMNPNKRDR